LEQKDKAHNLGHLLLQFEELGSIDRILNHLFYVTNKRIYMRI